MKYLFCLIIALSFGSNQAFWSPCPGSGVIAPDSVTSPNCNAERCTAVRGEIFQADILIRWSESHSELIPRMTAFLFGIGK
jgi:hypothetical protein